MIEKVENIELNYQYYSGKDLYSDGKIEDQLLEISQNYRENEWNQVIADKKSWPILYHFSHIRQNITDWLPITKEDTVLEIGSGCGAITGNLAKKAKHVTCIELSKKRSLINAYRNREFDNVEIMVGNFQDIEKNLNLKYDYITLIGVFEYSEGYIGTDKPYTEMLRIVAKHLKPNGKLIIAIENRLGMKYWAGCTEDHVGKFFEGIEDYPETSGVKTFSKKEMDDIFQEVGILDYSLYYPYPDYKFPMEIYSDKWLPKIGELRTVDYNFDRKRIKLFDEIRVYDTLIKNELFPIFSNSFLVIASLKGAEQPREMCIYSKFSNERSDAFSLRTEIWEDAENNREVRKIAVTEAGKEHINHIYYCMQQLEQLYENTIISVNKGSYDEQEIVLEYLDGTTLEQILDQYLGERRYELIWKVLEQYLNILKNAATDKFVKTDRFVDIFGNIDLPTDMMCPPICNIDAICSNIIVGKDKKWRMLDYEWSFDFPIPVNYQIYRALKYYLYTSTSRAILISENYFERMGITETEISLYDKMEENFQEYIQGSKIPMRHMYKDISPGVLFDIKNPEYNQKLNKIFNVQIYYDRGRDFSEDDCIFLDTKTDFLELTLEIPKDVKRLRIDPCNEMCVVKIFQLQTEQGEVDNRNLLSNGRIIGDRMYYFDTSDPFFVVEVNEEREIKVQMQLLRFAGSAHPFVVDEYVQMQEQLYKETALKLEKQHELNLSRIEHHNLQVSHMQLQAEDERLLQKYNQLEQKYNQLEQMYEQLNIELASRNALIHEMENTKVWKFYKMVKELKGNEKIF